MGDKFSYAIKFLEIEYWKLEEQILRLNTQYPDAESQQYVWETIKDLKRNQAELRRAIEIIIKESEGK